MSEEPKPLVSYTIERDFDHDCATLFAAFTTPELLEQWIWGASSKNSKASVDLKLGGKFEVSIDAWEPSEFGDRWAFTGVIAILDGPHRFGFTQRWLAPVGYNAEGMNPMDEFVSVEFTPTETGSHMLYRHIGIPDDGISAPTHKRSVETTYDDLAKVLAEA